MTDSMPETGVEVLAVTFNRNNGEVNVDYTGLNYLEAMSLLRIAFNQINEDTYFGSFAEEGVDDEDF